MPALPGLKCSHMPTPHQGPHSDSSCRDLQQSYHVNLPLRGAREAQALLLTKSVCRAARKIITLMLL